MQFLVYFFLFFFLLLLLRCHYFFFFFAFAVFSFIFILHNAPGIAKGCKKQKTCFFPFFVFAPVSKTKRCETKKSEKNTHTQKKNPIFFFLTLVL